MEDRKLYSLPLQLNAAECYYKGEGNANLVIALKTEPKVIRIPKYEMDDEKGKHDSRVKASLVYYEKVILPLFSTKYFHLPKLSKINEDQVKNLNEILSDVRPAHRQHKIIKPGFVTIFPDLTLLPDCLNNQLTENNHEEVMTMSQSPVFCVELKPKQGWQVSADRKFKKCSFCLNQYLKLSDNSIQSLSDYCPLDLFSGVESRMMNAIHSLLATPQNNIRVFQNGSLVFGAEVSASIDDVLSSIYSVSNKDQIRSNFSSLIYNLLTKNESQKEDDFPIITNKIIHDGGENVTPRILVKAVDRLNTVLSNLKPCDFSSVPLPVNSILDKILKIQKRDTFGADYVYNYYKTAQELGENRDISQMVIHFPTDLDPIENYLLSTMAKDCSILISFQKVGNQDSGSLVEDLEKNKFLYQVNVADVDAKPIHCIEKHYKRDNKIVTSATTFLTP